MIVQECDNMFCISINYKTADAAVRTKFAFTPEQRKRLIQELLAEDIRECVVLCTCNRTEVYYCGDFPECTETVRRHLADLSGISAEEYMRFYQGKSAVNHLFRVACGIESMVIGEDEILGQTKSAYQEATDCGAVQYELHVTFQAAIACAKKIKTCTALSSTSVSVATLAANEAARLGERVNVLLIGATGKIGSSVMKNLLSHPNVNLSVTLRNHSDSHISFKGVHTADYAQRYRLAEEADCIISATAGPHFTITKKGLSAYCTHLPKLLIDLAVPPDIDSAIAGMDGIRLIGIDHFERLAASNNAIKADSAEAACSVIAEETETLQKTLLFHAFLSYMERTANLSPEKLLYQLRDGLNAEQFAAVLEVLRQVGEE